MFCFHAYDQVSQTKKKSHRTFIQRNFQKKKHILVCSIDFNNQFVKVMRTRPIFQKIPKKKYFVFF